MVTQRDDVKGMIIKIRKKMEYQRIIFGKKPELFKSFRFSKHYSDQMLNLLQMTSLFYYRKMPFRAFDQSDAAFVSYRFEWQTTHHGHRDTGQKSIYAHIEYLPDRTQMVLWRSKCVEITFFVAIFWVRTFSFSSHFVCMEKKIEPRGQTYFWHWIFKFLSTISLSMAFCWR